MKPEELQRKVKAVLGKSSGQAFYDVALIQVIAPLLLDEQTEARLKQYLHDAKAAAMEAAASAAKADIVRREAEALLREVQQLKRGKQ